jgi:hypothetical protein
VSVARTKGRLRVAGMVSVLPVGSSGSVSGPFASKYPMPSLVAVIFTGDPNSTECGALSSRGMASYLVPNRTKYYLYFQPFLSH